MAARVIFSLLGALLPLFLWLCYRMGWPLWLGGLLLLPMIFRKSKLFGSIISVVAGIMGIATLIFRSEQTLLYYPLLMNSIFFIVFTFSVLRPPTIIERIARTFMPDLPAEGVRYTRKVTLVWCTFFLVNGSVALWTTTQSMDIWMLWNGLLSYLIMGALFAGEWLIRRRLIRQYQNENQ